MFQVTSILCVIAVVMAINLIAAGYASLVLGFKVQDEWRAYRQRCAKYGKRF